MNYIFSRYFDLINKVKSMIKKIGYHGELNDENCSFFKEYIRELDIFVDKLNIYSTFSKDDIGIIIASIISYMEHGEYKYISAIYKKKVQNNFYSNDVLVNLIVKSNNQRNCYVEYYRNPYLYIFSKNPDIIVMAVNSNLDIINFITIDNYKLYLNVDFKRFFYLNDFIYSLIEYRFVNDIKNISYQELCNYRDKYIENNYFNKLFLR